jgi:hypothetical protein
MSVSLMRFVPGEKVLPSGCRVAENPIASISKCVKTCALACDIYLHFYPLQHEYFPLLDTCSHSYLLCQILLPSLTTHRSLASPGRDNWCDMCVCVLTLFTSFIANHWKEEEEESLLEYIKVRGTEILSISLP